MSGAEDFVGFLSFLLRIFLVCLRSVRRSYSYLQASYRSLPNLTVTVSAFSSSHEESWKAERKMQENAHCFSRPMQPFSIAIYKINRHSLFTPSPSFLSAPIVPSFATPCSDKTDPSSASTAPFEP